MADVYAFPPHATVEYSHTISRPVGESRGLSGTSYYSQAQPARKIYTGVFHGRDSFIIPYVEQLKVLLDQKPPFVSHIPLPKHRPELTCAVQDARGRTDLEWTRAGSELVWTYGGEELVWTSGTDITASYGKDTFNYIDCTGLPADSLVAVPAEEVTVNGVTTTVLRPAYSNSGGFARIYTADRLSDGFALIGAQEAVTFKIVTWPDTSHTTGGTQHAFELEQIFQDEYADPFVFIDPWSET